MLWRKRVLIVVLLFVFSALIFDPVSTSLKSFSIRIITPFLKMVSFIKNEASPLFKITKVRFLIEENQRLKKEIALLKTSLNETRESAIENSQLRELLEFKQRVPYQTMPAQVIGRDVSNWNKTLIIDKGLDDGLEERMVVVAGAGLVGRIIEVYKSVSKVLQINDVKNKCGAMIQNSRDLGIITGDSAGGLKMIYLSRNADVKEGDIIITSGLGGIFHKGILVGAIISVYTEKDELNKFAKVRPEVDFDKIEDVLVVVGEKREEREKRRNK